MLGYALLPDKLWSLFGAVGMSLCGALLLAAVGSERNTLLALTPFAGVAATLVVPPALFLLWVMLRERSPAAWVQASSGLNRSGSVTCCSHWSVSPLLTLVLLRAGATFR